MTQRNDCFYPLPCVVHEVPRCQGAIGVERCNLSIFQLFNFSTRRRASAALTQDRRLPGGGGISVSNAPVSQASNGLFRGLPKSQYTLPQKAVHFAPKGSTLCPKRQYTLTQTKGRVSFGGGKGTLAGFRSGQSEEAIPFKK